MPGFKVRDACVPSEWKDLMEIVELVIGFSIQVSMAAKTRMMMHEGTGLIPNLSTEQVRGMTPHNKLKDVEELTLLDKKGISTSLLT